MSRSYRKTPIIGHGGGSEKYDKRLCNRIRRSRTKQLLHQWAETDDDLILPISQEAYDVQWSGRKDGKSWQGSYEEYTENWQNRWLRWNNNSPTKPAYYKDYYRWVLRK